MKNLKFYHGIRRLGATILVPVSLASVLMLSGCEEANNQEENTQEVVIIPKVEEEDIVCLPQTFSECVEEIKLLAGDCVQIDFVKEPMTTPSEPRFVSSPDGETAHFVFYQTRMTIHITGVSKEKIEDENFYSLFNQLIEIYPDAEFHIVLEQYDNQIDFSKINVPSGIYLEVHDSKKVELGNLEHNIYELQLESATLARYAVIEQIGRQHGKVFLGNVPIHELNFFFDDLSFQTFSASFDGESFADIEKIKANQLMVQILENKNGSSFGVSEEVKRLTITKGENTSNEEVLNTGISLNDDTYLSLDGIEVTDFSCPIILSTNNSKAVTLSNPTEGVTKVYLYHYDGENRIICDKDVDASFIYDENNNLIGIEANRFPLSEMEKIASNSTLGLDVTYDVDLHKAIEVSFASKEGSNTYSEEEFYQSLNQFLKFDSRNTETLVLNFTEYQNQIDLSKLQIPENIQTILVRLTDSKEIDLTSIMGKVASISLVNDSSLRHFDSTLKTLTKNEGELSFGIATSLEQLESFMGKNKGFQFYELSFADASKALPLLSNIKANMVSLDCRTLNGSEIALSSSIDMVSLYYADSSLRVHVGDKTSVKVYYSKLDINGPLVKSLTNASKTTLIAPLVGYDNGDPISAIEITKTSCSVDSLQNSWMISFVFVEDGTKRIRLKQQINEYIGDELSPKSGTSNSGSDDRENQNLSPSNDFESNKEDSNQYRLKP